MREKWREIFVGVFLLSLGLAAVWGEAIPAWQPIETEVPPIVKVVYLDVGHGDAAIIITEQMVLLMDAGDIWASKRILAYLEGLGIEELDAAIITSLAQQHVGGMAQVLTSIPVGHLISPQFAGDHREMSGILALTRARSISHQVPRAGETLELGEDIILEFLTPWEDPPGGGDGGLGGGILVSRLTAGEVSFLFASTLDQAGEAKLLRMGAGLRAQVLKVASHGGRTATSRTFLDLVSPEVAVISVGAYNEYGLPHGEVLTRLQARCHSVWRTDRHGTITVSTDGRRIKVRPERSLEGSH